MAAARASRSVPTASRADTAEAAAGGRGEEEEKDEDGPVSREGGEDHCRDAGAGAGALGRASGGPVGQGGF